jgi:hypothetical protein
MRVIKLTDTEWTNTYKPIQNHLDADASCNGEMFETYGAELDFVRQQDPNKIWTYEDDDYGNSYISSGYSIINRIGYFITEVPHEDLVIVDLERDN